MKLQAFRIKNFRSIKDTGWQSFSPDNITGLIGQNEAGKTAILEALYSFPTAEISEDFLRSDGTLPEVSCSFQVSWDEIKELFKEKSLPKGLAKLINEKKRINLKRIWSTADAEGELVLEEDEMSALFESTEAGESSEETANEQKSETETTEQVEKPTEVTEEEFIDTIFDKTPDFELFEDFASLLPDTIDLEDLQNKNEKTEGYKGAVNLLTIAGLDLNSLQGSKRIVENQIIRLNKEVTTDFREFWRQKIGKTNKISIEFELKHHDNTQAEKAGKPYIAFWIKDGEEKLHPKQRSKGVRWFTSFYLQLKASSLDEANHGQVFLIDEPGGSLHARAQEDVLKVFEDIANKVQIIYTTHSPYLIKLETIYRLLAVQRANEDDDKSETLVFGIHKLGSVSSDTLSPIYTLMGADFSHQQVIKKNNNILLEEISAYYYIFSFWNLVDSKKEAHFLPATGTSNIPQLANLFLGWGLDFGVVVDDDSSGRSIYNSLKRDLFLDDESEAKKKMMKVKGCSGIEDLFTSSDFKKHILEDTNLSFKQKNSEYMKDKPKAIFALKFMLKVKDDKIKISDLDKTTQDNIKDLVRKIESLLG